MKESTMKTVNTPATKRKLKMAPALERIDPDSVNDAVKVTKFNLTKKSVHHVGPRGFRLGQKWYDSIREGRGVAVLPSNLPKLIATAKVNGVRIPPNPNLTPRDIAGRIAEKLNG
jgi:hypothetical protein